jgi:arylsulfatase
MALTEYKPGTTFPGVIGRTADESKPAWPAPTRAKDGAPNVLFIVLDDTGYGHLGCYGSPIRTPNIDALARDGLLYTNMHTTALCSPSRSCIITGRNHHSNHVACLTNASIGFPGSDGYIPFENGFLSEILKAQGYNTYSLGKWHLAPEETMTAAGPFDRWAAASSASTDFSAATRISTTRISSATTRRPSLGQRPGRVTTSRPISSRRSRL